MIETSKYDAELEHQYQCSQWSKRFNTSAEVLAEHCRFGKEASEAARKILICDLNVSYGKSERQTIDIFSPPDCPTGAPIFVFIHGGYWQAMSKNDYSYIAVPFVQAGIICMMVDYDLAPQVTVTQIYEQILQAIGFIMLRAISDHSKGVYLCGHCAGAQLASMALTEDWQKRLALGYDIRGSIKGLVLISGVFDLQPLLSTSINDSLHMDREKAIRLSPDSSDNLSSLCSMYQHVQIVVAVGEHESPAFHRQSSLYYSKLQQHGLSTRLITVPAADHFSFVENLIYPKFSFTQVIAELISKQEENGCTTET